MKVSVLTPNRPVYENLEAVSVTADGVEGQFTIMPGHMNFATTLKPSVVKIKTSEGGVNVAVEGGFLRIERDKMVILSKEAILPEEIDRAKAEAVAAKAQQAMQKKLAGTDFVKVEAEMRRAILELKLLETLRT